MTIYLVFYDKSYLSLKINFRDGQQKSSQKTFSDSHINYNT